MTSRALDWEPEACGEDSGEGEWSCPQKTKENELGNWTEFFIKSHTKSAPDMNLQSNNFKKHTKTLCTVLHIWLQIYGIFCPKSGASQI